MYPPNFSNNELLQSSIRLLQMLSGLHYQSIFYSDRLLSESLSDFLLSRSTLLRASFRLRQCPDFSSSRTSTVTRLHLSFYSGRPPFEFHPSFYSKRIPSELLLQADFIRVSTISGLHPSFYNKRSPFGLPRQPISIRASRVSGLLPDSYKN